MAERITRRQAFKNLFSFGAGVVIADNAIASNLHNVASNYSLQNADTSTPKITSIKWDKLGDNVGLLGMGCMRFPRQGGSSNRNAPINQEATNAMIDYALAHGINYFDTASGYPGSEVATGIALKKHPRESYYIATKLSNFRGEKTLDEAKRIFANSLKSLQTDYVDFYLLHSLSGVKDLKARYIDNGILEWLKQQKKEGKIRHIGFSYHGPNSQFTKILDNFYEWEFVQIQMNYLDWEDMNRRKPASPEEQTDAKTLYEECYKRQIPIVIMEPIRGGALANVSNGIRKKLEARFDSLTPAGVALSYVSSFPGVMCTLSGMSNMEQLTENVETYTEFKPFSSEDNEYLMEVAHLYNSNPHISCTTCRYCMPCPSGVDIPGNFTVYNNTSDALMLPDLKQKGTSEFKKQKKAFLNRYKTLNKGSKADACTQCKLCVSKCPQHINIPDKLKMIQKLVENL